MLIYRMCRHKLTKICKVTHISRKIRIVYVAQLTIIEDKALECRLINLKLSVVFVITS